MLGLERPRKEGDTPMARPRLPDTERRDDTLPPLRVTAAERAAVERKAEAAGLPLSEFCRRAVFARPIPSKRNVLSNRALAELNRVGVNLNQIARHMNAGRDTPGDLAATLAELRGTLVKVAGDGS